MTTNMAELFALLRGPHRASSSSTPPSGRGPIIDPTSWIPPTQVPETTDAPALPTMHTSTIHPFTSPFPPPSAPTTVPLPPAAFLSSEQALSAPPPVSMPAPAAVYTVPPPMVFPASSAPAPTHLQAAELPPYPSLQPHVGLPYQAPPPINTTFLEPDTPTHATQFASPTHFLPKVDAEQEHRLKRMEETIRALQANEAQLDARYVLDKLHAPTACCSRLHPADVAIPTSTPIARRPSLRIYPTSSPQYRPASSGAPQSAQQVPPPQGQPGGAVQSRPRRQYPSLPVPLSHIYQQLRASNKIGTIAPGPNFDPTIQDRSKQCEYHRGPPGHTLNNCWKLRERIQDMINAKELTFNAVRSLNVQANPLPDHGLAQGPSINMISICALEDGESEQGGPSPFVIEYVPTEATPRTKGRHPAVEVEAIPEAPPTPPKKVTEEEAEALMKIIKTSEYKVVEQMAKSSAHVSLLALLLSSEPHRESLLWVLTAAQVPKGTPPDRIEETVSSIFSNTISFLDDELPSEGGAHSRALHIVCKCNNHIVGRVMIDNGSAFNRKSARSVSYSAPPAMRSWKPAGATTSTASPRTIGGSTGAYKFPRYLISFPELRTSSRTPFTALPRTPMTRLPLRQPCTPSPRKFLQGFTSAPAQENEELNNWTSNPRYSAVIADVLHSNPNLRHVDSNPFEECLGEPGPIYFGEGLDEDSQVPEIEENLRCLEDRQPTSLEPTEEINVGTENEPRTLKIGTGLDPTQRARMIDFLARYQEVFAKSYADMPGLDPSIVKHFLPLDTKKFPPKRQRADLLLRIKEEVVKQINAGFLEVCNYSEWVANIVPVEKKDGRVRVCVDY
ncbi:hypothetical protein CRG98_021190 [Punica granatum]|uniref:Uncharacterized protein n=1 Tax=Punica granatum TaxID=22663 RepID=A0A2I0JQ70_PUNGR|nr:hypothetical protein CRG98_021190 [Punica granatum]